jgi:hypothetical protein
MDEEIRKRDRVRLCDGTKGVIIGKILNFGFPLYEIRLQTGKIVTEATYRFDIVESNHESPFKDFYASNTAMNSIQHSPVLAPSCQSQTHDDFLIAQVLQGELQNAQDPETDCLHLISDIRMLELMT